MNLRKMSTKIIAVLMSVFMMVACCAPAVSAALADHKHKTDLNYVSIGDSMTNGYGLEGYNQGEKLNNLGELNYGEASYAIAFEEYLKSIYGNKNVSHTKLAISGMLSGDLLYLLGGMDAPVLDGFFGYMSYCGLLETYFGDFDHQNQETLLYNHDNWDDFADYIRGYYQSAVKDADIITLCVGNAEFGAFMCNKILEVLEMFSDENKYEGEKVKTLEDALALVESDELKEIVLDVYDEIRNVCFDAVAGVDFIGEKKADQLLECAAYIVASYLVNYEAILDQIVALNPNVDIILVGLFDIVESVKITVGEDADKTDLDVSEWIGTVLDAVNAYTAGIAAAKEATEPKYAGVNFYWAEQPDAHYFYEVLGELYASDWNGKDFCVDGALVRRRTISAYAGIFLDMLIPIFEPEYSTMNKAEKLSLRQKFTFELDDLKNFKANDYVWAENETDRYRQISMTMYLALEAGLVASADVNEMPLDDVLVAADMGSLADILGYLGEEIQTTIDDVATNKEAVQKKIDEITAAKEKVNKDSDLDRYLGEQLDLANKELIYVTSAQALLGTLTDFFTGKDMGESGVEASAMQVLCKIFLMLRVGEGLSIHPSAEGHERITASVINAYETEYTAFDKTVENLAIVGGIFFENYEEIYETLYKEAADAGKIDELVSYLEDAKEYIVFAKDFVLGYEEYFRGDDVKPRIETLAENALDTIDAAIDLITKADALDAETYAKFMNLVNALEVNLADIATLVMIVAEDAYIYVDENIVPVVIEQLLALNAKLLEAYETIEAVKAEITNVVTAVKEAVKAFFANNGFKTDYTVSADSFFLAIGDDTLYSETLAAMLGLHDDQFDTMGWNDIDSSIIAKADLITIGYNDAMINHFVVEQLVGYVHHYLNVDLKNEAEAYVEEAFRYFFNAMRPRPEDDIADSIIESVQDLVTGKIDEYASLGMIVDATKTELDWAGLVGEENAKAIEGAIDAIVAELLASGVVENYTYDISIYDAFMDNLGSVDPAILGLLIVFQPEDIRDMFGDYINYTLELPVVEAAAFAVESYIYNYVKFNIEYAQTVYAISALNPDAKIVLLSGYNAFDGIGLEVTIGEIVVDLGEFITDEMKAEINDVFDFAYGELAGGVDTIVTAENIAIALDVIDAFLAGLKETIAFNPDVDLVDAIKNFELTPEDVVKIVGEENADIANRILYITKFILVEANVYENVLATIPTAEDLLPVIAEIEAMIRSGFIDLDAIADGYMAELGLSAQEIRAIVKDLATYAKQFKSDVLGLKALVNHIFDEIKNTDIVFDEDVIDVGELFGDFISGTTSVHSIIFAHSFKNVIYVDIADAETFYDTISEGSLLDFLLYYAIDATVTDLSEAGHEYVAAQIYNALTITCDHYDADMDHYCDNGVCDEKLSECVDADKDHKCDFVNCGATLSVCADNDKDHKCDYCGAETSKCADTNNDHKCDFVGCGKELTKCADTNNDHKCDLCGKELTKCADENKDHKCDLCGAELTTCADADKDHKCDLCGKELTTCADANNDHKCDLCGKKISECADDNNDHNCDVCGAKLTDCVDTNRDGKCDICGAKLGLSLTATVVIIVASVAVAGGIGVAVYFFVIKKKV